MSTGLSTVRSDGVTKRLTIPPRTARRQREAQQSPGSAGILSVQGSPAPMLSQSGLAVKASAGTRCLAKFWVRDSLPEARAGCGTARPAPGQHPAPLAALLPVGPAWHHAPPAAAPGAAARGLPRRRGRRVPPPAAAYLGAGSAPALSARRPAALAGARGRRALQEPSPQARSSAGSPAVSADSNGFPRPAVGGGERRAPGSSPPRSGGGGCAAAGGSALRAGPRRGHGARSRCGCNGGERRRRGSGAARRRRRRAEGGGRRAGRKL